MPSTIDAIVQARDEALAALETAFNAIGNEIARTTTVGPYLTALTKRHQDLANQQQAILTAATDAILALPEVTAAVATLNLLSTQMKETAAELPAATKLLDKTGDILALGQKLTDTIAGLQGGH